MARKIDIETPRGRVFLDDKGTKASLEWNTNFVPKWRDKYQNAQKFVDSEVLRLCEPYTPLLTSMLIKSGTLGTVIGSGKVSWIAPYARYQYYGKVMVGSKPKTVSDKNLTYHGGGQRGSYWFQRMKETHGKKLIDGAQKIFGTQVKTGRQWGQVIK
jgi:hypothetical protein